MSSEIPTVPEEAEARHQRLLALDRAHVWHPFTQMQTWLEPLPGDEPVIIDHARGCWLFDTKGRKFSANSMASMADESSQVLWEEINPGNAVKGKVYFDIPKGAKLANLELHDSAFSGGVRVRL